jgi:hypothetical protein
MVSGEERNELENKGYDLRSDDNEKVSERVLKYMKAIEDLKDAFSAVYGATGAAILQDLLRDAVEEILVDNGLSPNSEQDEKEFAAVLLSMKNDGEW